MSKFRKALKSQSRLRLALIGPSGSGKTFSSLSIATHLGGVNGPSPAPPGSARIAVIDTEHGSASKFASDFSFDVLELGIFDPRAYIEAIQAAEDEGYDIIIIDSLSHEWVGKGGALELVDRAAQRSQSRNSFTAWKDVTPLHNALIDAMVRCRCHLIATMRAKTEYVLQPNAKGGMEPMKVGMGAVQRDGMEYEFDLTGDLSLDHKLIVTKTRCRALDGQVIDRPGKQVAAVLNEWLSDGAPVMPVQVQNQNQQAPAPPLSSPPVGSVAPVPVQPAIIPTTTPTGLPLETVAHLRDLITRSRMSEFDYRNMLAKRGVSDLEGLAPDDAAQIIGKLERHMELMPWQAEGDAPLGYPRNPDPPTPGYPPTPDAVIADVSGQASQAFSPPTDGAGGEAADETTEATADDDAADDYEITDSARPERSERSERSERAERAEKKPGKGGRRKTAESATATATATVEA